MELLREIAALFVEDTSDKLACLRSALQTPDSGGVEATAQSLKGAAANIGAKTIEAVSVQLETIAREGRLNDASTVLDDLENAVEAFNEALKERNIYLER